MFMPARCPNAPLTLRLRPPSSKFHPIPSISVYNRPSDPIVVAQFQLHQPPHQLRQRLQPAVAAPNFRHSRCSRGPSYLVTTLSCRTTSLSLLPQLTLQSSIRLRRSYFPRSTSPILLCSQHFNNRLRGGNVIGLPLSLLCQNYNNTPQSNILVIHSVLTPWPTLCLEILPRWRYRRPVVFKQLRRPAAAPGTLPFQ